MGNSSSSAAATAAGMPTELIESFEPTDTQQLAAIRFLDSLQEQLDDQRVCRDIVRLLKSSSRNAQAAAAFALYRCSAESEETRRAVHEFGGIFWLVELLSGARAPQVCEWAAATLGHCASGGNEICQNAVRDAGGLEALLALVEGAAPSVARVACQALGQCCAGHSINQGHVAGIGGIEALVLYLRACRDSPEQLAGSCATAAVAVRQCCEGSAINRRRLLDCGGVSTLLSLCKDVSKVEAEYLEAVVACCGEQADFQRAVVNSDGVAILGQYLRVSEPDLVALAAAALASCCLGNARHQRLMTEMGALQALAAQLCRAPDARLAHALSRCICPSPDVQNDMVAAGVLEACKELLDGGHATAGAAVVSVCSVDNAVAQNNALQAGLLGRLFGILGDFEARSERVLISTATALACVCNNNVECKDTVDELDGVAQLTDVLRVHYKNGSHELQRAVVHCLGVVLYAHPANCERLDECGGIPFLLAMLGTYRQDIQMAAACVVSHAAAEVPAVQSTVCKVGGIRALSALLSSRHPGTQMWGLAALDHCCLDNSEALYELKGCQGIDGVFALLSSAQRRFTSGQVVVTEVETLTRCLRLVATAAELFATVRDGARSCGVIQGVANILRHVSGKVHALRFETYELQRLTLEAIGRLAFDNAQNALALQAAGVFSVLPLLLRSDDEEVLSSAAFAVGRCMADCATNRDVARSAGILEALLALLHVETTGSLLRQWVISALAHAVNGNAANAELLRVSDGLQLCVSLLLTDNEEIQWRLARLLGRCAAHGEAFQRAIQGLGGADRLRELSAASSRYVRSVSADALRLIEDGDVGKGEGDGDDEDDAELANMFGSRVNVSRAIEIPSPPMLNRHGQPRRKLFESPSPSLEGSALLAGSL